MKDRSETYIEGLGPKTYARWRRSELGEITEALEDRLLLDLAGDVRGRDVLDVGCGDGTLAVMLSRRGATVVGVDAAPAMIRAAIERATSSGLHIGFCVGQAERLPIASNSFDLVIAKTILCFVQDAAPVFEEMARILRPGGTLVIGELGKWSTWAAARRIRAWLGSRLWRRGRFRTKDELRRLAESAGISVHLVRGAVYYPRWRWAARLMAPLDGFFARYTTLGGAFLALCGTKPMS
jgi:ubiquinone biosynthesis O-methyltransferase